MNPREERIAALKKEQGELLEAYKAARERVRTTLNPADTPRLESQAGELKKKSEAIDEQIKRLKMGEPLSLPRDQLTAILSNEWRSKVHRLNNTDSEKTFRTLLDWFAFPDAVLMLIQQSDPKMAMLYLKRIKAIMQDAGGFRPIIVSFSETDTLSGQEYIQRLAGHLGCPKDDQPLPQLREQVIDALFEAAPFGQILYLEVECAETKSEFYTWFREQFWKYVVAKLPGIAQNNPSLRIIAVILVRDELDAQSKPDEIYRSPSHFVQTTYYEIELETWSEADVNTWILTHAGKSLVEYGSKEKVNQLLPKLAPRACKWSHGMPFYIYNNLLGAVIDYIVEVLAP